MRRREFITLFGGVVAWPFAARAQQPPPVIGFISPSAPAASKHLLAGFHRGLGEIGYVEGQNVIIEYRWADGRFDRLPLLAADLVRQQVSIIVSSVGTPTALAAKAATQSIPIVFSIGTDPVSVGLVASMNRPGSNVTGISTLNAEVVAKRLELLHEFMPKGMPIALLINPRSAPFAEAEKKIARASAGILGARLIVVEDVQGDVSATFASIFEQQAGALMISADPVFLRAREHLIALSAKERLPAIYAHREFVTAGGLMSYGTDLADAHRHMGIYVGRILSGVKPADLPVLQPTKFELLINLKTAKALGLDVPPMLLARADEVIE